MLYIYLYVLLLVLVAITILFLYSLKSLGIPGNAQLIVDAWNSVSDSGRSADLSPDQTDDLGHMPAEGAVTNGLGQLKQSIPPADITKFSYQNRCWT